LGFKIINIYYNTFVVFATKQRGMFFFPPPFITVISIFKSYNANKAILFITGLMDQLRKPPPLKI